jgi:hypothetical protein
MASCPAGFERSSALPGNWVRGTSLRPEGIPTPFAENLSEAEPALARELFDAGVAAAEGGLPEAPRVSRSSIP